MNVSVLIVEDNQDMRRSLSQLLEREGYACTAVASCEDGIDQVDEHPYDAAIVDINLPGKSGFDLVEYIREEGHEYPLIAMTARDTIDDKLKGFDAGLTDYIVKPFNMRELLARLNTHLRRTPQDGALTVGDLQLNPAALEFQINGNNIELTQLEMRLMQLLMQHAGTLVQLDDLIDFAWGESDRMVSPPIRVHIANLRRKIGDDDFSRIRTVPGVGYILSDSGAPS